MEELSAEEFSRLSRAEQDIYLATLLGEEYSSDNTSLDGEDKDWLPGPQTGSLNDEVSDTEQNIDEEQINAVTTEESPEDDEDRINTEREDNNSSQTVFVAKDGTIWNNEPPSHHQTPSYNIIRERSGLHRSTHMLSIRDTFNFIFSNEMMDIIVRHTNRKATADICHADHIKKRRKTRKSCQKCTQPVCDEHANTITICKHCPVNI